MIGGFAVIAWPVRYGETGVMTFMVSHDSDVYEKDLGPTLRRRRRRSTSSILTSLGKGRHDAVAGRLHRARSGSGIDRAGRHESRVGSIAFLRMPPAR